MYFSIVLRRGEIHGKCEDRSAVSDFPDGEGDGATSRGGFDAGSKLRHSATGVEGMVEIESVWTAGKREELGLRLKLRSGPVIGFPP